MKQQRQFIAERVAVQHCAELLGRAQPPFDMGTACAEFAAALALALPERLQTLLLGPKGSVGNGPAEALVASALAGRWSGPSLHYALATAREGEAFVVSFDNATALSLTDRMFGGSGGPVAQAPAVLPQSAMMAVERLVRCFAEALADTLGAELPAGAISANPSFRRLGAFRPNDRCLTWTFTVQQDGHEPWNLRLTVADAVLRPLLEQGMTGGPARGAGTMREPQHEPFGTIPLPLTAVLAELRLPLATLASLAPGQTIPFAPRREVPLVVGGRTIAAGTIGALDERVALRLVRLT